MNLKLNLLKPFSDVIGKKELNINFQGSTFKDLVDYLVSDYPKLHDELYDEDGKITDYLSVFVNDKPLSVLAGVDTELSDGDELLFFFMVHKP